MTTFSNAHVLAEDFLIPLTPARVEREVGPGRPIGSKDACKRLASISWLRADTVPFYARREIRKHALGR